MTARLPDEVMQRLAQLLIDLPQRSPAHRSEVSRQYSRPVAGYLAAQADSPDFFRNAIRDFRGLSCCP